MAQLAEVADPEAEHVTRVAENLGVGSRRMRVVVVGVVCAPLPPGAHMGGTYTPNERTLA